MLFQLNCHHHSSVINKNVKGRMKFVSLLMIEKMSVNFPMTTFKKWLLNGLSGNVFHKTSEDISNK